MRIFEVWFRDPADGEGCLVDDFEYYNLAQDFVDASSENERMFYIIIEITPEECLEKLYKERKGIDQEIEEVIEVINETCGICRIDADKASVMLKDINWQSVAAYWDKKHNNMSYVELMHSLKQHIDSASPNEINVEVNNLYNIMLWDYESHKILKGKKDV